MGPGPSLPATRWESGQIESFEDASFDVILCHNVLEYVEDRKVVQGIHPSLENQEACSIVKHNEVGRVLQTHVFEMILEGA